MYFSWWERRNNVRCLRKKILYYSHRGLQFLWQMGLTKQQSRCHIISPCTLLEKFSWYMHCMTDSNPLPAFKWYFRPNGTSKEKPFEIQDILMFDSLQVLDSGTYTCIVVNEARSNSPSATSHVSVSVKKYHGCSQCRYMLLSVKFAITFYVLIINRKIHKEQRHLTIYTI